VRSQEGTGLGLALVKALAALHGGDVSLHSTLGEGTTVCVKLPHAAVRGSEEIPSPQSAANQAIKGAA
jgi:signal transduction histidine kinase